MPTLPFTVANVVTAPDEVISPLSAVAAVTRPLPFTVTDANVPTFEFTVASVVAIEDVPVPVTSPVNVTEGEPVEIVFQPLLI